MKKREIRKHLLEGGKRETDWGREKKETTERMRIRYRRYQVVTVITNV